MTGQTVEFPSDACTMRACVARPEGVAAQAPAMVVIQEWWGLNEHIKDIASRLAQAGYVGIAPDLYSRLGYKVTTDATEAATLMESLSSQAALRDLNATIEYLKQQDWVDPNRIGVIGFCMGGTFALTMATHNSDLKAAVAFYGKTPPMETISYLLCPVLYHYGAKDQWVTRKEVDTLALGLEKYGKPGHVRIYPEADHAFFNNTRPEVYRADDATRAWEQTLAFLSEHLQ